MSTLSEQQRSWLCQTANIDPSELSQHLDSGISSDESRLPKPQFYPPKRTKRRRKSPHKNVNQSSPIGRIILDKENNPGICNIMADIEKDLSTEVSVSSGILTSTPCKGTLDCHWISPIRPEINSHIAPVEGTGLTPLKGSLEEGNSFGKLLGDLQLDSIIDEGITDMENISFTNLAM
jgi:hypothetical protein